MKRFFLLLVLPLLAITFNSCSDDGDNGGATAKLLKKIDYGADEFEYFEYDSSGRISKHTYTNGSYIDIANITYTNNTITCIDDSGNKDVYTLDDNGYAIKREGSDSYTPTSTFTYSNGYLSKSTGYYSNGSPLFTFTYTWNAGNLVKSTIDINSDSYTYTYNNHENKINFLNGISDFPHIGTLGLKGMTCKNLPASYTYSSYGTYTYEYTFDSDGYPTEVVETDTTTGKESVIKFTYY